MDIISFLTKLFDFAPKVVKWFQEHFPLKRLDRLIFQVDPRPQATATIKLKLFVTITNQRRSSVVLSSAWFEHAPGSTFRIDPILRQDAASHRYHCSFLNLKADSHDQIDFLLRRDQTTTSYIGLDPAHNVDDVQRAVDGKLLGHFFVYVTWWEEGEVPRTRLLKIKI